MILKSTIPTLVETLPEAWHLEIPRDAEIRLGGSIDDIRQEAEADKVLGSVLSIVETIETDYRSRLGITTDQSVVHDVMILSGIECRHHLRNLVISGIHRALYKNTKSDISLAPYGGPGVKHVDGMPEDDVMSYSVSNIDTTSYWAQRFLIPRVLSRGQARTLLLIPMFKVQARYGAKFNPNDNDLVVAQTNRSVHAIDRSTRYTDEVRVFFRDMVSLNDGLPPN
jgi:hypothetical protein